MASRCFLSLAAFWMGAFCIISTADEGDRWPRWRGPLGTGVAEARDLPDTWSETENVIWKMPLPCWSGGSPIVWGDRVYFETPAEAVECLAYTSPGANPGKSTMLMYCVSAKDGSVIWKRELSATDKIFSKNNGTSSTPVTDGKHIWTILSTGEVMALSMEGEILWKQDLQKEYGTFGINFGYNSSPLLYKDILFAQVIHGYTTDKPSYVVAFDALTGKTLWRTERPTTAELESRDAYTTPALLMHEGKPQFIVSGADWVTGYEPETGKEIWRAAGLNPKNFNRNRFVSSPVVADGMVFAMACRRPTVAYRAGGVGDCTATHTAWVWDKPHGPDVPTPVYDQGKLYMLSDTGKVTCLDAKTGETLWGAIDAAEGIVSASPVLADGKLYITTEKSVTTVFALAPEPKPIAQNALDCEGPTLSTPAIAGNRIFIRTATHLYCVGKKSQ